MLVRDVMTSNPITVRPEESLRTASDRMAAVQCRRLPVVDELGKVCGIITDRDLRLAVNSPLIMRERWQDEVLLEHTQVAACMTPDPICTAPDIPLEDAVDLLLAHKIGGVPVVEGDHLVGVLTATDLMRALARLLRSIRTENSTD
jgi:acetoin utilization protein AcuB